MAAWTLVLSALVDLAAALTTGVGLIVADDGGAQVSVTGGTSWSTYMNQPTAQFYRVSTDNSFPYRIYGAQQDNSAIRIRSRGDDGNIGERNWDITAGGEKFNVEIAPFGLKARYTVH